MRILKRFHAALRDDPRGWLLMHQHGEYEYRNPDSVYVHRWNAFATKEAALEYLDQHIPKADQPEWTLYQVVPAEAANGHEGAQT